VVGITLPRDVDAVDGVYVDGVPQIEGLDYEIEGATVRLRRPVTLPDRVTGLGHVLVALCAGVYPQGRSIDVVVQRAGRRETITA
jgi:hypothetical protein